MDEAVLYALVNVCECTVGMYACMHVYICMYVCIYMYLSHVVKGGGRNKCVKGKFIVETVSICICLCTYVKGYIHLCMLW